MGESIAFIDLQAQRRRIGSRIDDAINRVLAHGRFILGPEVEDLEERLAAFVEARHVTIHALAAFTDLMMRMLLESRLVAIFRMTLQATFLITCPTLCPSTPDRLVWVVARDAGQ